MNTRFGFLSALMAMLLLPGQVLAQDAQQMDEDPQIEDAVEMQIPGAERLDDASEFEGDGPDDYDGFDDQEYNVYDVEMVGDGALELVPDSLEARLPNPEYRIEDVMIVGNYENSSEQILKMLDLDESMTMDALEEARIRLALSGLFDSVEMDLYPGHERGTIVVSLKVDERSHLQINNYSIGSSDKNAFWLGLDATWLAPFGTNHRFRMAYGATTSNDYSLSMNYLIPTIEHVPVSLMFSIQSLRSHEDVFGPSYYQKDYFENETFKNEVEPFARLDSLAFERHGASIGLGYAPLSSVRLLFRLEYMRLTRRIGDTLDYTQPDKDTGEELTYNLVDDYLLAGDTNLTAAELSTIYDSRQGRQLPNSGHFVMVNLKGTAHTSASDYAYFRMMLAHQSNFRVAPQHIIRLNTFGGFVLGQAPFFEKFFFNDFDTLSSSRFFMINPSSRGALDMFKTGASGLGYEDFLVHIGLGYAWQPMERKLEIFVNAGATWADSKDSTKVMIGVQPRSIRDTFPVDFSANIGVRFKTEYGLFSVSLSNILDLIVR